MTDTPEKFDYSKTLYLPETEFPMRAGLPQKEPEMAKKWKEMNLYKRLRASAAGREKFVLHDGPPYANGNIHIGHALNKVLKDVITRSFQMRGYDSNYVPGWDCHGLPIEWKIEEKYREKGKDKNEVPVNEFRKECREFAQGWINIQAEEFRRLGIEGDFDNPYTTMAFHSEARIAGELLKIAMSGQLYRGSKPIMWSVVERTALAEAEVEYAEVESDTIWVKFPVVETGWEEVLRYHADGTPYLLDSEGESVEAEAHASGADIAVEEAKRLARKAADLAQASVVIWTTTPWTIPGNRAISFSAKVEYGLFVVTKVANSYGPKEGDKVVLAKRLAGDASAKAKVELQLLHDIDAADLGRLVCSHPLSPLPNMVFRLGEGFGGGVDSFREELKPLFGVLSNQVIEYDDGSGRSPDYDLYPPYSFPVPLLDGDHVTDDAGTGFVHTAPSHGREDFDAWMGHAKTLADRGIDVKIPFPVDDAGFYTEDAPGFGPSAEGGAARVLDDNGKKGDANKRVMDALIKANNLFARGRIKHEYPHSWRSKKPVIFRNTPQWFVYMDKTLSDGSTLRTRALSAIDQTRFVPAGGQNRLRAMIEQRPDWVLSRQRAWGVPICVFADAEGNVLQDEKVNARILEAFEKEGADAWFAEGAKERFLAGEHDGEKWQMVSDILDVWFDSGSTHTFTLEDRPDLKWPADVYLEGSDQHRGWFHSSLLESCATRGRAPYNAVITHGFTMAEDGRKMSKSLGNTVTPQDVMKESGADILRLWVMSTDYAEDQRLGKTIIQTNIDAYRKIRNTIRWMLGTLAHDHGDEIAYADLPELEKLMLHRLAELDQLVRKSYDEFDFKRIVRALSDFANVELSAFYFDIRKDTLYCDAPSSLKRRSALFVIRKLFDCLVLWFAPMMPFTTEEAWLSRDPKAESVHLEQFPVIPADWSNDAVADKWKHVRTVRRAVTGALEVERKEKRIGSSLEAAPVVHVADAELLNALDGLDFAEICITSDISVVAGEGPAEAFRLDDGTKVAVEPKLAEGTKCARSWKITRDVGADPDYPDVSARDAQALRELKAIAG